MTISWQVTAMEDCISDHHGILHCSCLLMIVYSWLATTVDDCNPDGHELLHSRILLMTYSWQSCFLVFLTPVDDYFLDNNGLLYDCCISDSNRLLYYWPLSMTSVRYLDGQGCHYSRRLYAVNVTKMLQDLHIGIVYNARRKYVTVNTVTTAVNSVI